MRTHRVALAFAAASCFSTAAPAYNEFAHHAITGHAFAQRTDWVNAQLLPPKPEDLAAFRAAVWKALSETPDPALRKAFLERFPAAPAFDAWAFKEFFMLDPAATVHGFDPTPDEAAPMARGPLLQLASRWNDDDKRNRSRFWRNAQHEVQKDPNGQPLPFDPITLCLGSLTGTSSQAHAHYALADPPLSSDPRVLMKDPAHFAEPSWTQAYGAEFAQLYTDLALIARAEGAPASPWIEATFAGASFHQIEDAANQIHTLQVGPFTFFQAAILQSLWRDVVTQGGLFGERAPLTKLGIRIISNHHLLLEDLFARRIKETIEGHPRAPEVTQAFAALDQDDAAFATEARAKVASMPDGRFAEGLTKALVLKGGVEGPEAYSLIWRVSLPTLHDGRGHEYDGDKGDDPDKFIEATTPEHLATLSEFYTLESKGVLRAATALRLWEDSFEAQAKLPDVKAHAAHRILAMLIPYHQKAAERRAAYVPEPLATQQKIAWGYPIATLVIVLLIARLFRRKKPRSFSGLTEKMP